MISPSPQKSSLLSVRQGLLMGPWPQDHKFSPSLLEFTVWNCWTELINVHMGQDLKPSPLTPFLFRCRSPASPIKGLPDIPSSVVERLALFFSTGGNSKNPKFHHFCLSFSVRYLNPIELELGIRFPSSYAQELSKGGCFPDWFLLGLHSIEFHVVSFRGICWYLHWIEFSEFNATVFIDFFIFFLVVFLHV